MGFNYGSFLAIIFASFFIQLQILCFRLHYSSDDVSSELIYGYFGDRHCNNSRVISNYNLSYIKFHFRIFLLLFLLHLFRKIVYLYLVVNFSKKIWLSLTFCLPIQECKKLLIGQNDIMWNLQNIIFWKIKINYKKIIMITRNSLIIVTGSAKQCGAQIYNINNNL
jgi:hypothetical protein